MSKPSPYLSFQVEGLPFSLNQMLRGHWSKRTQIRNYYAAIFSVGRPRAAEPCQICVTWRTLKPMDWDNCYARCKEPLDALVQAGVISNDCPTVVTRLEARQERVKHKGEQGFTVEIQEYLPFTERAT